MPAAPRNLIERLPSREQRCGMSSGRAAWRIAASLARRRWRPLPVPVVDIGGALVHADLRTPLGLSLYRYGLCSPESRLLRALLRRGDVFVDAGANVGLLSLLAAAVVGPSGRVLACEPAPGTMALLAANAELNAFAMLERREVALSDQPGSARLVVFEDGSGLASFSPAPAGGREVEVAVTTLDELTAPLGDRVAVVKLDIEGAEVRAIRGAPALIARAAPLFLVEVEPAHLARQHSSADELRDALAAHGYEAYALDRAGGVSKLSGAWLPPDPACPNLLLASAARAERLTVLHAPVAEQPVARVSAMDSRARFKRVAAAVEHVDSVVVNRLRPRVRPLAWRFAPSLMADRAHRHQLLTHASSGRLDAARQFVDSYGQRVRRGPFSDMRYGPERPLALQKLLGIYECELHEWIEAALERRPARFVDIGASDGYYAVGVALRGPTVEAFESSRRARRQIAELARSNGVSIRTHGIATAARVRKLALDGALVLSDCEGAEDDIFDPVTVKALRTATVVIEVHDTMRPGTEARLRERFAATHDCQVKWPTERDAADYPELARLDEGNRRHAEHELRSPATPWLLLTPKAER